MPRINIYEHSETYSFQVRNNNYATVALPLAAIWGPSFVPDDEEANPDWLYFPAGYRGTTNFIQTFRGANTYLGAKEKSYDYCLKLLSAGYDILVKRVDGLGNKAAQNAILPLNAEDIPSSSSTLVTFQQEAGVPSTIEQAKINYRFLDPSVEDDTIVWDYSTKTSGRIGFTQKYREDENTDTTVSNTNNLSIHLKAGVPTGGTYIVAFDKPIVDAASEEPIEEGSITISDITAPAKHLTVRGTVKVKVYSADNLDSPLEEKTINLTESYYSTSPDAAIDMRAVCDSIDIPNFTYIYIQSLPLMLQLKDAATYHSDVADTGLGFWTVRVNPAETTQLEATTNLAVVAGGIEYSVATGVLAATAKHPGSYGNNLKIRVRCSKNAKGYKIGTVEVFDNNGHTDFPNKIVSTDQLLELVSVAFDEEAATDSQPLISEATYQNIEPPVFYKADGTTLMETEKYPAGSIVFSLGSGTDYTVNTLRNDAQGNPIPLELGNAVSEIDNVVAERFDDSGSDFIDYIHETATSYVTAEELNSLIRLFNQQILYNRFLACVDELTDPLVYDWDALFCGIAGDQQFPKNWAPSDVEDPSSFTPTYKVTKLMTKMVEVAAASKCGCALIGTPFGMPRGTQTGTGSAATKTGALKFKDDLSKAVGTVYSTFGEVVGPWCKTTLALSGENSWICPEAAHLLLIIAAQGIGGQNKWWMIPAGMLGSGVVHTPEYKIKKAYLDLIQDHDEGVCLNPLMEVPGKGFTCFGNSTLWNKPLGTYNALQNLSTRLLTNRVKQRIWDTALQILFKYNNEDAYSHFYAGLSPLLDEMRAVGALTGNEYNPWGYRIIMNPDIINLDRINANTVIGRVELAVTGVIDTVDVDLFLLPPTGFQESYD